MQNIKLLNKISKCGTNELCRDIYNVGEDVDAPVGILVRSAAMHEMEIPETLLGIARAGAGVNNIPIAKCTEAGVVVFNTPGANANAVKELVICGLMLSARNIIGGIEWAKGLDSDVAKTVEKGKGQFAGHEISGKTLGVIGLGAIGGLVANTAIHLGMNVIGCDPYLSIEAAWNLNHHVERAATYDEIYAKADYITFHIPATETTRGIINAENIAKMRDGVKILNFSRSELASEDDVIAAIESGKVSAYVTDFPTERMLGVKGVVAIPHLGASTEESEDNCAKMAAIQLDDYIRHGNIKNSVNFPAVSMPESTGYRVCVLHKNVPAMISKITQSLSEHGINIENMTNKSRGDVAYSMFDVCTPVPESVIDDINAIDGIIRGRFIDQKN